MLVIGRGEGQSIRIGPPVEVAVLCAAETSATLGVKVPADLPVYVDEHEPPILKPAEPGERTSCVIQLTVGQKIWIGHDVQVVLVATRDQCAKLGIMAPPDTPVYRSELLRWSPDFWK
jgi:sRNA-binding carbon storage regulator CsrA